MCQGGDEPLTASWWAMVSGEFSPLDWKDAEREGYLMLHEPLDPRCCAPFLQPGTALI